MMLLRFAFIFMLATAQLFCGSSIDSEEAAVIRAYVDSNLKKRFDHVEFSKKPLKVIYIGSMSSGFQSRWQKRFSELGSALKPDTAESFLSRNDREYAVNPLLTFSLPHVILPEAKIAEIFKKAEGWEEFYHKYPASKGIIWFSRAGFSADGTQALFYFSNQWQGMAGEGWLVLMEKDHGWWKEAKSIMIWIS